MTTLLAALIGGGLAIAGGLVGVFAADRRERNRWRRDAQLKVSTELLSSLQEVIRPMMRLAYLAEKPPQPTLTLASSAYHEASVPSFIKLVRTQVAMDTAWPRYRATGVGWRG